MSSEIEIRAAPTIWNAAKAIMRRDGAILLQECVFDGRLVYLLPGGTQEFGEPLAETVRREALEETGMRVQVGQLLWVREFIVRNHLPIDGDGDHEVECIYRCVPEPYSEPGPGAVPDMAQIGVRWVPLAELSKIAMHPETVKRLLIAWDQEGAQLVPAYLGDCL